MPDGPQLYNANASYAFRILITYWRNSCLLYVVRLLSSGSQLTGGQYIIDWGLPSGCESFSYGEDCEKNGTPKPIVLNMRRVEEDSESVRGTPLAQLEQNKHGDPLAKR